MGTRSEQAMFIERMQKAIERYAPILERHFEVSLGGVVARPLRAREFVRVVYLKSEGILHRRSMERTGRPPTKTRRILHALEKALIWLPAWAWVCVRFWLPDLVMKWRGNPPTILISFMGWSKGDYRTNAEKIDQWVVHELAHGIWQHIAQDEFEEHDNDWRVWNEGFAHFVADELVRDRYPADAKLTLEWPGIRQHGKQLVSDLVRQRGPEILRVLPRRWRDFQDEALKSGRG